MKLFCKPNLFYEPTITINKKVISKYFFFWFWYFKGMPKYEYLAFIKYQILLFWNGPKYALLKYSLLNNLIRKDEISSLWVLQIIGEDE